MKAFLKKAPKKYFYIKYSESNVDDFNKVVSVAILLFESNSFHAKFSKTEITMD